MANNFSVATENLAQSLDTLQDTLGDKIKKLAEDINTLSASSTQGDVSSVEGVKDGDVVRLQYQINTMEKAAETGASTFTKAQGISKQVVRTLAGG